MLGGLDEFFHVLFESGRGNGGVLQPMGKLVADEFGITAGKRAIFFFLQIIAIFHEEDVEGFQHDFAIKEIVDEFAGGGGISAPQKHEVLFAIMDDGV